MAESDPKAELDVRYSSKEATPTEWAETRQRFQDAEVYWLSTVRHDGRPHVTPLLAVWLDGAAHFCTGPREEKAKNLVGNAHCVLTTGSNELATGLDVVLEGEAVRVTDDARLRRLADLYAAKYGEEWRFTVRDGEFHPNLESPPEDDPGPAFVYAVAPSRVFGFGRGDTYSQTRWRFEAGPTT
jgi:nitroimidazol reductase NimA-like FMN-containing flavoprotein (pyridoxamine 5'-phosphate oxidase superfamily)